LDSAGAEQREQYRPTVRKRREENSALGQRTKAPSAMRVSPHDSSRNSQQHDASSNHSAAKMRITTIIITTMRITTIITTMRIITKIHTPYSGTSYSDTRYGSHLISPRIAPTAHTSTPLVYRVDPSKISR
jgi:hypothetical protein